MNKKYLTWAIIVSALTITYYAWLIPAWIHTNSKVNEKQKSKGMNDEFSDIELVETGIGNRRMQSSGITWDDLPELVSHGEPPPKYAFWIMRPKYKCDSFLKINVSQEASYVVKVVDSYDGEVILMYYLPAGDSQEINIPLGTFEIRYTSGTEWFGENEMFGNKGSYAKADRLFTFGRGSGYVLTLYRVPHGNLHTSRMKKEDF